jgi:hypothetical protein
LFCFLIGLYNFGKQHKEVDTFESDSWVNEDTDKDFSSSRGKSSAIRAKMIEKKRDEIADKMWKDYQEYIQK